MKYFQSMMFYLKKSMWLLPFIAFLFGYLFLQYFITDYTIQTPSLLGIKVLQATQICSKLKLNIRIIDEKEVADIPEGTIIEQKPSVGKLIKPLQSIFVIITKSPQPQKAPHFIKKEISTIQETCIKNNIKNTIYYLESSYPKNECFGQIPLPEEALEHNKILCYVSTGTPNLYLFPNLVSQQLDEVINFLKKHSIGFTIYDKNQQINIPKDRHYKIINQKPLAGTVVQLNENLYVQLQIEPSYI